MLKQYVHKGLPVKQTSDLHMLHDTIPDTSIDDSTWNGIFMEH
jgi:hypothetical protein